MRFGIRGLNRLVIFDAILLFGLLGMTARTATDYDLWWHLRTGQLIVDSGHIPHADPFSFTRAGTPWIAQEWLSEVIFYGLWHRLGAAALIGFSAIVTTAGFMLLYARCRGSRHWAALATALGAVAAAPSWGARPQMFTFTLASLLLWLIESGEKRPKLLLWIPPLFLLWLNLHAGFALGFALLCAYAIGLLLESAAGTTQWQEARPILLRMVLVVAACLVLVELNPSGTQLYRYPFDTLRSPGMRSVISEWFSPDFHQLLYRPFWLVWILLLATLASSRRVQLPGRTLLLLLLTAIASLDAARHIPIFILVAMPLISAAFPKSLFKVVSRPPFPSSSRPIFNGAVVTLIAALAITKWVKVAGDQKASEANLFPEAAVSVLRSSNSPQRIFAYYGWGGYVIWKLYPGSLVFVDGRADVYGDDLLRQFETAVQFHQGWREILDRWPVDVVLLPTSCALAEGLRIDPGWRSEFSDFHSVIFVRSGAVPGDLTQSIPPASPPPHRHQ